MYADSTTLRDRQLGCLLGLVVGDALGAAVEFKPPGSFPPVTEYRAGGPHRLAPGEWTDDTSMALALADSLLEAGWDLADQARRYVNWYRHGEYSVNGRCFDIGNTIRQSLHRFEHAGDPTSSASTAEDASGNGSIMRLAPVVIRYAGLFPASVCELAELAAESSRPTHASPTCLAACRYFSVLLAGLMHGLPREEVLAPDWAPLDEVRRAFPLTRYIERIARGSFRDADSTKIVGSGYVAKSLEAALWAFAKADDFRAAVLAAVNLGGDADTTGAVCGQLAGAYWGCSGIPAQWLSGLAQGERIQAVAARLVDASA